MMLPRGPYFVGFFGVCRTRTVIVIVIVIVAAVVAAATAIMRLLQGERPVELAEMIIADEPLDSNNMS